MYYYVINSKLEEVSRDYQSIDKAFECMKEKLEKGKDVDGVSIVDRRTGYTIAILYKNGFYQVINGFITDKV